MEIIPLSEIDPEARKIAVLWCEEYIPHFAMQEKHKLASDIMNYSLTKINNNMTEITKQQSEVAKKLDFAVLQVIGQDNILGFTKAFEVANATAVLKELLNDEYMKPIMLLQGNRLGFKTDKDTTGGYSKEVVKNCLIEAVLMGVQPSMNHFNIISNNCYITKEGFGYLLSKLQGLSYEIVPFVPKVEGEQATIVMKITWSMNGGKTEVRENEFVIKVNRMMGADAIIGKATRKARAWLYNTLTGSELGDGDISDAELPKSSNTIILGQDQPSATTEVKKDDNNQKVVDEAKARKEKLDKLVNAEANVVTPESSKETKPEAPKTTPSNEPTAQYKDLVLKMTPPQVVAEFKEKIPFTPDRFLEVTGLKVDKKTAIALLIAQDNGKLNEDLEKVYGYTLDHLMGIEAKQEPTEEAVEPTLEENDVDVQLEINDLLIDAIIEPSVAAKELGFESVDAMLLHISVQQAKDYVASKKG